MKQVMVEAFGGSEQLQVQDVATPEPGAGEVRVKVTSIGMNHAELMGRRGEYKISTGEPPFIPGLECGGVIDAVGEGVDAGRVGERVVVSPDAPRLAVAGDAGAYGGTYRSVYICRDEQALTAPQALPDEQLGAVWLAYLTAWGCLVWMQQIKEGDIVALPAASSSVALAAAQIVKAKGGITIGMTTSPGKVEMLQSMDTAMFDHLVVTHDEKREMLKWYRDMKSITDGQGVDVFFDPVASGSYLTNEIRCLAKGGCIWVYGLLGSPDTVDVTPLIRLQASIRGWGLTQLVQQGASVWRPEAEAVLQGFADGQFKQHIGGTFKLDDVQNAHIEMEKGHHIGKLVLVP